MSQEKPPSITYIYLLFFIAISFCHNPQNMNSTKEKNFVRLVTLCIKHNFMHVHNFHNIFSTLNFNANKKKCETKKKPSSHLK